MLHVRACAAFTASLPRTEMKMDVQKKLHKLSEQLHRLNESLTAKAAAKQEYDMTISETEAAYAKIVASSQTLLTVLQREASQLNSKRATAPLSFSAASSSAATATAPSILPPASSAAAPQQPSASTSAAGLNNTSLSSGGGGAGAGSAGNTTANGVLAEDDN